MKGSKLLMTIFVAVLILSLTITTVGAQTGLPPVGEVDDDGDLIADVFPQVDVSAARELPNLENPAAYADFPAADGVISAGITPIFPVEYVYYYTKYPIYKFSEVAGATKYKIEVYDIVADPDVLLYTFKGPPDCEAGVCELSPTTTLKPLTILMNNGLYGWRVKAKTATGWDPIWSAPAYFYTLKNGFNSDFSSLDKKWYPVYGNWNITSAGYAKTKGEAFFVHSAIEKHIFTEFYTYEVQMKHKDDPDASNRVYFQAFPTPLDYEKGWANGYLFVYRNNQMWQIVQMVDGVFNVLSTGTSTYIKPYVWNKITVMTDDPYIDVWINENYLGYYNVGTSPNLGYVGFGAFSNGGGESFLVDYAWLEYSIDPPYPWPWAESVEGTRNPAYELKPDEKSMLSSPDLLP